MNNLLKYWLVRKALFFTFIIVLIKITDDGARFNNNLTAALCSDGERSYSGSSYVINEFKQSPEWVLSQIYNFKEDFIMNNKDCYFHNFNEYLRPEYYNAILILFRSHYGTEHILEVTKNRLIKYNQKVKDEELDYFIKELIKI